MPFALVIDQETSWGEEVHVSKTSVCSGWGAVAGDLVYFADKSGRARGSISGTQLEYELIWQYASPGEAEPLYDAAHRRSPLRLKRARVFHGFELESDDQPIDRFPAGVEDACRRVLAEAMAAGSAYHRDVAANRDALRELREVYRRSGGEAAAVSEKSLVAYLMEKLRGVGSYSGFMETPLRINADALVPAAERARWLALPDTIVLEGDEYPLDYAFEGDTPVVRARVPAKLLYSLDEASVPDPGVGRPLHWTVTRGKREAVRAASIDEAKLLLSEAGGPIKGRGKGGPRGRKHAHADASGGGADDGRPRRKGQRAKGGGHGGGQGNGGPAERGRRKGGRKQGKRRARH
jgi:ATP-dependent helicase HrpA